MSPRRKPPAVVAFGGGHGLYGALSALRYVTTRLTAVVTVADDGGSSGRLRTEFDILPPGDLRMALAALCGDDEVGRTWADVLQSRFSGEGPLAGHAIGNLLIAGLWQRLADPVAGLDMVGALLRTRGRVLPMAAVPLTIEADVVGSDPAHPDELTLLQGQATVAKTTGDVRAVRLIPDEPPARPEAVGSVLTADHLVLGPGSWFTSVIPHLLVPQLRSALLDTRARLLVTLNLEGQPGETPDWQPEDLLAVLYQHAPELRIHTVLADTKSVADVEALDQACASWGCWLEVADLAIEGTPRHDPQRLATALARVFDRHR